MIRTSGVAEDFLHRAGVHALADQQRPGGVAHVVDADLPHAGLAQASRDIAPALSA